MNCNPHQNEHPLSKSAKGNQKESESTHVKSLVRHCRSTPAVPLTSQKADSATEAKRIRSLSATRTQPLNDINDLNLAVPQLHTSLKIQENLLKMKTGIKSIKFEQQSPPEPNKASNLRKVNIRFDEQIYKNLIDLKVTEEDLCLQPISSVRPKKLRRSKEPIPDLSNYFQPSFDKEYIVKAMAPHFLLIPQLPNQQRHPSAVYEAYKQWTIDDYKFV